MASVKPGWEDKKFYGYAGKKLIKGQPLGKLSTSDLQAILEGDPVNGARMIDGDQKPAKPATEPAAEKPKA